MGWNGKKNTISPLCLGLVFMEFTSLDFVPDCLFSRDGFFFSLLAFYLLNIFLLPLGGS